MIPPRPTMKPLDQNELAAIATWLAKRQPTQCPRPGSGELPPLQELTLREHMHKAVLRRMSRRKRSVGSSRKYDCTAPHLASRG
jgi:hypothetical protein